MQLMANRRLPRRGRQSPWLARKRPRCPAHHWV